MQLNEEKKQSSKLRIVARITGVILAFILVLFTAYYLERYFSSHYKKAVVKQQPVIKIPEIKVEDFRLLIPKISVNANIVPKVDGTNQTAYNEALKKGVAHYKGTALPNSGSNIVIFGHSSSVLGFGEYSKIFAGLDNLKKDDEITIHYNGKAYKYLVESKRVISAKEVKVLSPTEREQLTLLTCWPIGSDRQRLVVIAKPVE